MSKRRQRKLGPKGDPGSLRDLAEKRKKKRRGTAKLYLFARCPNFTKAEEKRNRERAMAREILDPDKTNFMHDLAKRLARSVLR